MRIIGQALIGLCLLTVFSGCARQLTRIETAVNEVVREQRVMEQRQERLAQDLADIRERLDATGDLDREGAAALNSRLDALSRAVRQLDAGREEQEALLRRIQAVVELMEPGAAPSASTEPGDEAEIAAPTSSGTEIFDAAFADYTQGNFSLAREGFTELLARFPHSALADDAAYWVGETWYSQGEYEQARSAFDDVVTQHPNGDKLPSALLKLGYAYLELGQNERARDSFRRLRDDHPDSDEALVAQHKMESLDQTP